MKINHKKHCLTCKTKENLHKVTRSKHADHVNQYYTCRNCARKRLKKYRKLNPEIIRKIVKRYEDKNRLKVKAWIKANNNIKVKKPCEVCGEIKVDMHHDDYTKPLLVRFLCRLHHRQLEAV